MAERLCRIQRFADAPSPPPNVRPVRVVYEQELCRGVWVRNTQGHPIRFDNHEPIDHRGGYVYPWGKGDCPVSQSRLHILCDQLARDGIDEIILNYEVGPMDLTNPTKPLGVYHLWVHLRWIIAQFSSRGIRVITVYNEALWGPPYSDRTFDELKLKWLLSDLRPLIKIDPLRTQTDRNNLARRGRRWAESLWTSGLVMYDGGAFGGDLELFRTTRSAGQQMIAAYSGVSEFLWMDGDSSRPPMSPSERSIVEDFFSEPNP